LAACEGRRSVQEKKTEDTNRGRTKSMSEADEHEVKATHPRIQSKFSLFEFFFAE
jgi:hypothetical protein